MVRCEPLQEQFNTPFGNSTLLQYGLSTSVTNVQAAPLAGVNRVIYLVPGNPGVIFSYDELMRKLYETHRIPVIGSNHSGLSRTDCNSYVGNNSCEEKVKEKEDFILKYIPRDTKIIMVGQSFGAFVALKMMKNELIREQTEHIFLLTPALDRLRESLGFKLIRYLLPLRYVWLHPWVFLWSLLPEKAFDKMFSRICVSKTMMSLSSVRAVENIIQLAYDEYIQIDQRDDSLFKCIQNKCTLVYAQRDEWVPLESYKDIKATYEDCDAHLLSNISHTFVAFEDEIKAVLDIVDRRINSLLASNA